MNRPANQPPRTELWRCDAGSATVAVLDIPGARSRRCGGEQLPHAAAVH
jgi:hypothetical protein